jgi:tetratricopeptide (TPR) repeat protein
MKKYLVVIFLIVFGSVSFAQKNEVQTAANHVKYEEWAEAKAAIDKAAEYETTSSYWKMHYYRAKTYMGIARSKEGKAIDSDAAKKAAQSWIQYLELDNKKMYEKEARDELVSAGVLTFRTGLIAYQNEQYDDAISYYKSIYELFPFDINRGLERNNISKGSLTLNSFYAASAKGDKTQTKEFLQELIDMQYNDPSIYFNMAKVNLADKDTATAIEVLSVGRELFEDNATLINMEMDLYIKTGRMEELMATLNEAIELDEYNSVLYFSRGILNQQGGQNDKAEQDFLKSLEVNPDNIDANFTLGAFYYNQAAEINAAMNNTRNNDEYAKLKVKLNEKFQQAVTYFETADEIKPGDVDTLNLLKQLYFKLGENDKYQDVKEQLEDLN